MRRDGDVYLLRGRGPRRARVARPLRLHRLDDYVALPAEFGDDLGAFVGDGTSGKNFYPASVLPAAIAVDDWTKRKPS